MLKKFYLLCPMCKKVHDYYILEETQTPTTHCECGYMFCGRDEINEATVEEPTCQCVVKCEKCKCHQYCDDEVTNKEV